MKSFSKDAGSSHVKVLAIVCIALGVVLIAGALLLPKLFGGDSKDEPEETTAAVTTAEATRPEETTEAVTEATAAAQPTTEAPTTAAPTTAAPTTAAPTTAAPTTEEPTTEEPKTEEPTTEIETSTEETMEYKTYMDKIRAEYVTEVPKDVQKNNTGREFFFFWAISLFIRVIAVLKKKDIRNSEKPVTDLIREEKCHIYTSGFTKK